MIHNIILIIISLYIYITLKVLNKKLISKSFSLNLWDTILVNIYINIINYAISVINIYGYLFCYFFLRLISSILMRRLLMIIYYKFYNKIRFLNSREFMLYKFFSFEKIYIDIFFFVVLMFFPKSYIIYLILISMFNFNLTDKKYDEAILNKYEDCNIRLFNRGKKKIAEYKKFILSPENNNKYKFHTKYLSTDKNHLILIWGVDFKFCKKIYNEMFKNNNF